MVCVQHDCGTSPACPAWLCERLVERAKIETEINAISINIEEMLKIEQDEETDLGQTTSQEEELLERGMESFSLHPPEKSSYLLEKSPVKELIDKFEEMNKTKVKNTEMVVARPGNSMMIRKVSGMFEKRMNTSDHQFEMTKCVDDDTSKPVCGVDKNKELPDKDIDEKNDVIILDSDAKVVKTSKRMGEQNSSAKPECKKKKVWTKTKTGLYGWKSVKTASTSAEIGKIQTKIHSVKVNNTQQSFKSKSNFIRKWSLTAAGGGVEGEVEMGSHSESNFPTNSSARKYTNKGLVDKYAAKPEVNQPRL
jgi:hypothetical protein